MKGGNEQTAAGQPAKGPILIAMDGGEASEEALRQADIRARDSGRRLLVRQVLSDPAAVVGSAVGMIGMYVPPAVDFENARLEAARNLRERVEALIGVAAESSEKNADIDIDVEVDVAVLSGRSPHAAILEEAERVRAELIVVGSHGQGRRTATSGVSARLLGSVAERIVRYSHCAVLVARPRVLSGIVMVASDFSDPAVPAVQAAAEEAARIGGAIVAVHCIDLSEIERLGSLVMPGGASNETTLAEIRGSAHAQLAAALAAVGSTGECRVLEGHDVGKTLADTAAQIGAEIIVVGTSGRTGLRRVLLGSVAETIVRESAHAVLVVRLATSAF